METVLLSSDKPSLPFGSAAASLPPSLPRMHCSAVLKRGSDIRHRLGLATISRAVTTPR
jgi:hypothetical protein